MFGLIGLAFAFGFLVGPAASGILADKVGYSAPPLVDSAPPVVDGAPPPDPSALPAPASKPRLPAKDPARPTASARPRTPDIGF